MFYNADPGPYIDHETGILQNLLNITTKQELEDAEAAITSAAIASIPDQPPTGNFNLGHLQDIHWELFNVIYGWAGNLRIIEIAKGNTRFANSDIIEQAAHNVFKELHAENLLKDLQREKYIQRLAHFYSEVNVLHPFREGNGRTQRVFFSQLVAQSG